VVSADKGYVFHNRLTHSLKVAQLARRMGEKLSAAQPEVVKALGGLDVDAAEAAALAHDLGHPPFGHLAEEALNELCEQNGLADGFEGNAQSFRIVTKIAVGDAIDAGGSGIQGLNLCASTLNGILKYPWLRRANAAKPHKWGAYESEREVFDWARTNQKFGTNRKSIEAELMDWADDITFSVHDLIDFYCAGQIPLHQLAYDTRSDERNTFFDEVFERDAELQARRDNLENAFNEIIEFFPLNRRYVGDREERHLLWQFTTMLISRFVNAISLSGTSVANEPVVRFQSEILDEIRMLKELTWHYVILHNDLATNQRGHRHMVTTVFNDLRSAADNVKHWKLFPPFFKDQLKKAGADSQAVTRIIADYLSSMTERELTRLYGTLRGRA